MNSKLHITNISNYLAVGSLTFLGFFFILDHYLELWSLFENYTGSTTCALILALPVTIIIYTLGIIINTFTEIINCKFFRIEYQEEIINLILLVNLNNEPIMARYLNHKNLQQLFQGLTISFIFLSVGCLLTYNWIPKYEYFSYIFSVGLFIFALLCPLVARKNYKQSLFLVKLVKETLTSKDL
jgi:hypothetical protein